MSGVLSRRALWLAFIIALAPASAMAQAPKLFPANGAKDVSPDVQLKLTFATAPSVGKSGRIVIQDAADGSVADTLDLSIPPSPNPTGRTPNATGATQSPPPAKPAGPGDTDFQSDQIGGTWFRFFPVIVRGNVATIQPHHNKLKYGRTYRVTVDGAAVGSDKAVSWTFSTKAAPPGAGVARVVVSADGKGDFNTVQGAIDWAPAKPAKPVTIFIRNGRYEEIVYMKGKSNLILRGESRDGAVVGYPNNSAFNRVRPAFTVTESNDIQLSTFTINNYFIGQAEALLMRGERNIVDRMTLNGSGDAFTTYGSIYMVDSKLVGDGDTILAYAALYCLRCEIQSVGPFVWARTPKGQHGNVFIDSKFIYLDKPLPWSITPAQPEGRKTTGALTRLPKNGPVGAPGANFPYAEMVMVNTKMSGVPEIGWGPIEEQPAFDWSNLRLMETGSTDLAGKPIDLSKRHKAVKILDKTKDAETIANYRNPEWVLGGWKPVVR